MRLVSWNVNGIRAAVKKDFLRFFDEQNADFFCVQETKVQAGQIDLDIHGYTSYWSYAERKGYAGTAIFARQIPLRDMHELGDNDFGEGRVVALEYDRYFVVTCYTPNIQSQLARSEFRKQWDDAFVEEMKRLDAIKPVVMCGDFNVARSDIDIKHPEEARGTAGYSDQERTCFEALLSAGFTDTFRLLHPDATGMYTWWSYQNMARRRNDGWRIDYFLVSDRIASLVKEADILKHVMGSDHAPVTLDIDL